MRCGVSEGIAAIGHGAYPHAQADTAGLEPLQALYGSKAFRDEANRDACYLSSVVVVARFQRFMQRAAEQMPALRAPLYVTAHDFDYIASLLPGA